MPVLEEFTLALSGAPDAHGPVTTTSKTHPSPSVANELGRRQRPERPRNP